MLLSYLFWSTFYLWWPADILHLYGGYMSIGALLVFMDKKYYLIAAAVTVAVFHLLLLFIPYETGWDFGSLQYLDFWTVKGFPQYILQWLESCVSMVCILCCGFIFGETGLDTKQTQRKMFITGLILFVLLRLSVL